MRVITLVILNSLRIKCHIRRSLKAELLLSVASNRHGHCQFSCTGIISWEYFSRKQGSLNDRRSFCL